jgi:hypothetical protein
MGKLKFFASLLVTLLDAQTAFIDFFWSIRDQGVYTLFGVDLNILEDDIKLLKAKCLSKKYIQITLKNYQSHQRNGINQEIHF